MKKVDLSRWPRARHFELFKNYDVPHLNITADVDVTKLHKKVKKNGWSFFATMLYYVMRVLNEIPEFRYRIRNKEVIEHERVHPSYTVLFEDDLFGFVTTVFEEDIDAFQHHVDEDIKHTQMSQSLKEEDSRDDLIYISAIPWVSFTSVTHPWNTNDPDSFPRVTWGKFYKKDERVFIPVSVAAHHALCDGVHVGKFFKKLTNAIENIEL